MAQIFKTPRKKRRASTASLLHKRFRVTIESLDHKGLAVARHDGQVIFVEGALPGEVCDVEITEQKNRFLQGKLVELHTSSEYRRVPFCQHVEHCGGCQSQHIEAQQMLHFKQQAVDFLLRKLPALSALGALPWQSPLMGNHKGYRRKTRLSVDARNKNKVQVGFRRAQSKSIIHLDECQILHVDLQGLIQPVQNLMGQLHTPSAIGHVSLAKGEELVQVCVRCTKTLGEKDRSTFVAFGERYECQVVLETNDGQFEYLSNVQDKIAYVAGREVRIQFSPNDFIQVNDQINQRMIEQAQDWLELGADDNLLDLFCGVGNFSIPMAHVCQSVVGIEGVAKMVQQATENARLNGRQNTVFLQADLNAEKALQREEFTKLNKVLLDPAREGASGTIKLLKSIAASHILYVSCNPSTFARDAEHILQQGFRLEKIGLMDMFPNTAHTELMALFLRS